MLADAQRIRLPLPRLHAEKEVHQNTRGKHFERDHYVGWATCPKSAKTLKAMR